MTADREAQRLAKNPRAVGNLLEELDRRANEIEARTKEATVEAQFQDWFKELKEVAVKEFGFTEEAAESMPLDYRDYFESGYEPREALVEDFSYA